MNRSRLWADMNPGDNSHFADNVSERSTSVREKREAIL